MATFTPFTPNALAVFQFQATLDSAIYNVFVTWNTFGQRWYINIYDQSNTRIFTGALIGSPNGVAIQAASWSQGVVTLTTEIPHGYKIGQSAELTITGMTPAAYNGSFLLLATGSNTLIYRLAGNPGLATALGAVTFDISMTQGYFASTLVFRQAVATFEVSP